MLPNIISVVRIFLSFYLLYLCPFSLYFYLVYFVLILSDILDGFIARRYALESKLGSALDSIGDFLLVGVLFYIFLPIMKIKKYYYIIIITIFILRMFTLFMGLIKYKQIPFKHTYLNKITGFLLCLIPILYLSKGFDLIIFLCCFFAILASIEELIITIKEDKLNRDIKSIFNINKKTN